MLREPRSPSTAQGWVFYSATEAVAQSSVAHMPILLMIDNPVDTYANRLGNADAERFGGALTASS
jgi:hypothetical protein